MAPQRRLRCGGWWGGTTRSMPSVELHQAVAALDANRATRPDPGHLRHPQRRAGGGCGGWGRDARCPSSGPCPGSGGGRRRRAAGLGRWGGRWRGSSGGRCRRSQGAGGRGRWDRTAAEAVLDLLPPLHHGLLGPGRSLQARGCRSPAQEKQTNQDPCPVWQGGAAHQSIGSGAVPACPAPLRLRAFRWRSCRLSRRRRRRSSRSSAAAPPLRGVAKRAAL